MRIHVRDKVFNIDLVSNWVHERFTELMELGDEISGVADKIETLSPENWKTEAKELKDQIKQYKKLIITTREEIIKELMITNNIEYDSEWWKRRTSTNDVNAFIFSCIEKDREALADVRTAKKKSFTKHG